MLSCFSVRIMLVINLLVLSEGGMFQFYSMIRKIGQIEPTKLLEYGCYCGLGNSGTDRVVDCLDMCCYHHDYCLEDLEEPCPAEYKRYTSATYKYNKTTMECITDQEECLYKVCKCDHEFGKCVRVYKNLYKRHCVGAKSTHLCSKKDNYTLPTCQKELIPEMIKSTKDLCSWRTEQIIPPPEAVSASTNNSNGGQEDGTHENVGETHHTTTTSKAAAPRSLPYIFGGKAMTLCLVALLLAPVMLP